MQNKIKLNQIYIFVNNFTNWVSEMTNNKLKHVLPEQVQ